MQRTYLAVSLIFASLAGCATVGRLQASCEKTSTTFPELAACLNTSIAESGSSRMQNNPEVKLYVLKAEQLSQRVKNNEMSDIDARVELQTMYVNLKNHEDARKAAGAAAYNASRPRTTNCYAVGNTVQCNSY